MKKEKPFKLESDLCAAFLSKLPETWTAYPETAGWDILLVRKADGVQVGIQAKLKLNGNVLTQCLEGGWAERNGPDYRAVLVPAEERGWERICAYIGISVIGVSLEKRWSMSAKDYITVSRVYPALPDRGADNWNGDRWYEWLPAKRCALPEYVPDCAAGTASPIQLTDWKIKAIKACIILERHGYLTRADFKHLWLDHRRWIARDFGWLTIDETRKVYVAGPRLPDLKREHPRNWDEIEADWPKWAPPALRMVSPVTAGLAVPA